MSADLAPAIAARARQDMVAADAALTQAAAQAPDDPRAAFLLAQLRYERGLPAADLFARAQALDPANRDAVRNRALALVAEGDAAAAQAELRGGLARWPDWLDGLRVLASLRWTSGDAAGFDTAWADAARARPDAAGVWLGWFAAVAQVRDWDRARAVVDAAQARLGVTPALLSARVLIAGETGDLDACGRLLDALAGREDDFLRIARIRLLLRRGDPRGALGVALLMLGGAGAGQVWPYVGTCWRLLDDPRADWLEPAGCVAAHDVALSPSELAGLAATLRGLHTARAAYAEQTVRSGTQTDRSVLLRHEPILARTRAALMEAVAAHVAALPPPDAAHPLLGRAREDLRIAGSWSVRLTAGGHNVTHSHPLGWLSSAFYVACDNPAAFGPAPAGAFHHGAPPAELGLDLPPRGLIAPRPGQLVLFPSYAWHGTVPIAGGERLNIAFDIVPAKG